MSIHSPKSPRSGETPPNASQEETADVEEVESLFDARPADEAENRSILTAAFEALSKACRDAAAWIAQVFSGIGGRDGARVAVSAPRNFKKGTLPSDLQQANDEALASQKAAVARMEFVESADKPPAVDSATTDPDREAFDAYVRLCKREGREPGSEQGASSHRDMAVRHARSYVQLVAERQSRAAQEGKEFWLGSDDQEKLRAAQALLKRQDGGAKPAPAQRPIQSNSTQQLTSFMAWRDWSKNPEQPPVDAGFSMDAAVAYAHELCANHAGKDAAKDPRAKDLLGSAYELIAKEDHYRRNFEIQREAVELVRELDELREPVASQAPPGEVSADEVNTRRAPPAPPPPRVRSTPSGNAAAPTTDAPPPPLRRVPSVRPMHASWNELPQLSSLDDALQSQAAGLLHLFFQRYVEKLDSGILDFADHPEYFSPLAAAAAVDFLQQADARPGGTDVRSYAAANYIVREYERRWRAAQESGS